MANIGQQLHLAVRERKEEDVIHLLESGADINVMCYGWTPLQLALSQKSETLALLLIDRGCDIYFHNKNNVSPFEDAIMKNLPLVVQKMLEKNMDPNTPLSDGDPPLCVMCKKGWMEIVKELIHVGKCNINLVDKNGESPLHTAAKLGYEKITQLLLEAGADSDAVYKEKQQTPLIAAAANDNFEVVKSLLKHGCDVNFVDIYNKTALWYAFGNNSQDVMKLLLKSGADKSIKNSDGQTILDEAKENDDDDVIELLTKFEKSWT